MSANIVVTLKSIIDYKDIFFEVIDKSDLSNMGDEGLSASLYNGLLGKAITSLPNQSDGRALHNQLSLANLKRCDLIDSDERAGLFYLQPWLIEMIRSIEKKRIKYLSSADLDGLRRDLNGLYNRAVSTEFPWIPGEDDYEEFRDYVYTSIRRVYTMVTDNIRSLQGRANYLGVVLQSQDTENMDHYEQQAETLKSVRKIYDRNVIPTLQFLNERYEVRSLAGGSNEGKPEKTAIDAIQGVIDTFNHHRLTDQAIRLQTLKTKLVRSSDTISEVRLSLEAYVLLEREMRQFYDKVETRWNTIKDAIEEKKNGRQKGSITSRRPELFTASSSLTGLKRRNTTSRPIDLSIQAGRLYLDEHIRHLANKEPKIAEGDYLPARALNRTTKEHHISMHQLQKVLIRKDRFEPDEDIILSLHQFLSAQWPRYELGYVWEALPMLLNSKTDKITASTELSHITHGRYRLTYYPRFIEYGAQS